MKRSLSNAVYGALDYICYPAGMLLLAPIILRRLGTTEYGLWMVANSVVSAGAIIASGFCDAGIQQIARLRSSGDTEAIVRFVRTLLTLTITLGLVVALLLWFASATLTPHLAPGQGPIRLECLAALRLAGATALLRAIEVVPVCVQRAYESYGPGVKINVFIRFATLGVAALLAACGSHTPSILAYSLGLMAVGVLLQFVAMRRFVTAHSLLPKLYQHELRQLFRSGVFVWLQAVASVLFRQCDRILLGLYLGAAAVVPYALSVQLAEPLFGFTASALSFFFPYLSRRVETLSPRDLRKTLWKAWFCNLLMVVAGAALLLFLGPQIIRHWAGIRIARETQSILPLITFGSALSGLSVVGVYAAQALGLFRTTATISVVSRCALSIGMVVLLRRHGLQGLAVARLFYGVAALLVYMPIVSRFWPRRTGRDYSAHLSSMTELQEGVQP